MLKQNCRKWADVIPYKGNAMYLRHITKEEGLVMLQKHGLIQVFGLSP